MATDSWRTEQRALSSAFPVIGAQDGRGLFTERCQPFGEGNMLGWSGSEFAPGRKKGGHTTGTKAIPIWLKSPWR